MKWYAAYENTRFEVLQQQVGKDTPLQFNLKNDNLYTNLSAKISLGSGWSLSPGLSAAIAANEYKVDALPIEDKEIAANLKLKILKRFSNRFKLIFGAEYIYKDFTEELKNEQQTELEISPRLFAAFGESEIIFSKSLAMKLGLRTSYSKLDSQYRLDPRASLALKSGLNGQFSLAYGKFHQQPQLDYLKFDSGLAPEDASHYILNYQWSTPGYLLRAEAYYKDYDRLVKYNSEEPGYNSVFNNQGEGYARGIDLFYRDDRSLDYLQYWISYSFIDSQRDFKNYPEQVTPQFVANHSASIVTKYWLEKWQSQLGFSYNFSSGRPYENPNTAGFMNQHTRAYHNLSFNWAYLLSKQKIFYFSISNLTGSKNVFNFEYASTPGTDGVYERRAIRPAADRFFFFGFFWTISDDRSSNQLDNL